MARSKRKPKQPRRVRAASTAIVQLVFEVKLPNGPNTDHVIVAGGADADRDGTVEDNGEYGVFTRNGNTWTYTQTVPGPVAGMLFYVQLTVGPNVPYELKIQDSAGNPHYSTGNVTIGITEYVRWSLA